MLIAQRWILAALRNRTFFSLGELNEAIAELRERLNTRPFQKLEGCRRSRFAEIDRPAMRALPTRRYELAEWKKAKVNIDYLVAFEDRHYSVPYALIGARVEVRATGSTIEILHGSVRVASHARSCASRAGVGAPVERNTQSAIARRLSVDMGVRILRYADGPLLDGSATPRVRDLIRHRADRRAQGNR